MTRRGRMVRRAIGAMALVLVVLAVSAGAFLLYARYKIDSKGVKCTTCVAVGAGVDGAPASFNILVLGSDSRSVLDPADQKIYDPTGADANSGQRADTIAVLHVDPATGKAVLVNIPRDLKVPTADGTGIEKINAFYNSGVSGMVAAVEQLTGLSINHYVEVNFDSFRTITDQLGGVSIYFNRRIYDANSGLNQPKGCDLLTGDQALAFVRDRDTDSDYGRIARQQLFVQQMMKKILTPGTLLNPVKLAGLINLGLGTVTHDSGLTLSSMTSLALQFHSFNTSDIDFRVLPSYSDASTVVGGVDYDFENTAQAAALFSAIKTDAALPDYGKQGGVSSTPVILPSSVPVTVLNGTGTSGLARGTADELAAKGYPVSATHNADNANYAQTAVYYTAGNQVPAQFLQTSEFPAATLAAITAPLQSLLSTLGATSSDAVVVLGANAVHPGGVAVTATPKATPTPATSPSPNLLPAGPAVPIASQSFASAC